MLKKVLIISAIIISLLAAGLFYLNYRNRTLSPPARAELTSGELTVSIPYSRPSVRGRLIFGTKEQNALQPYGEYWRLGANEATEITINKDVTFNDQALKAGTYRMYAIPGPDNFEILLNTQLGQWGALKPDPELDILHTKVPTQTLPAPIEMYTINLRTTTSGIDVVFEWSTTQFIIPITPTQP
jgi:hypothetical protein